MKIIAMLGDSHTWGEGVGADYGLVPPAQCSDLRMLPFGFPSYVNLIRDAYSLMTDSHAEEYYAEKLTDLCEIADGQFGIVNKKSLVIEENFLLCRIFLKAQNEKACAKITVDGKLYGDYEIQSGENGMNKCIRLINVRLREEAHKLKITSESGTGIYVHRIEFYSGEYAVVNCGVGSCTVERYIKEYFDKYIAELNPYAVVFEGCTVNDWLSGKTLAAYSADIELMIQLVNNCTQKLVMHTTFPVTGGIYYGDGINSYDEYVDTARRTAQKNGIPVADCYATAQKLILAVPIEKRNSFMHHDKWHPNGTGHYLYATTLLPYIIFVIK